MTGTNPSCCPEGTKEPERNQVWKFDGRLWRVDAVRDGEIDLSELLGERTMTAMPLWLQASKEWELIYEHRP